MYTLSTYEPKQSWEIWHKCYGHVSYTGLKKLVNQKLVDGLTVNTTAPPPDCIRCTEAKQSIKPFPKESERTRRKKGELTHINLWGKYDITSISGHQYYLLLVDDATRYITVNFLKAKSDANKHIKAYLTHCYRTCL